MAFEVADDGFDGVEADVGEFFDPGVFEGELGDAVDLARHATRDLEGAFGGVGGEQVAAGVTTDAEAVAEVVAGFLLVERVEVEAEADALVDGGQFGDHFAELGLADEDEGEVIDAGAVQVGEEFEFVEGGGGHFLGFVEDEDEVPVFGVEFIDDLGEAFPPGMFGGGAGAGGGVELLEDRAQHFGEGEGGVLLDDDSEALFIEAIVEDGAGEGLAAADFAGEHADEHGLFADEEAEAAEGFVVIAALEEEPDVPGGFEGAFLQAPIGEQVHCGIYIVRGCGLCTQKLQAAIDTVRGPCAQFSSFGRAGNREPCMSSPGGASSLTREIS